MTLRRRLPQEYVDYLICRFIYAAGQVKGRIRMQKAAFLLGTAGLPLFQDFFFHLRGPYSPALANTLGELVDSALLHEQREELGPEVVRYNYQLTEVGAAVLKDFEAHPSVRQAVDLGDHFQPQFVKFVGFEVRRLELSSSLLYWRGLDYDWDEAAAMTANLKGTNLGSTEMQEARRLAEDIASDSMS